MKRKMNTVFGALVMTALVSIAMLSGCSKTAPATETTAAAAETTAAETTTETTAADDCCETMDHSGAMEHSGAMDHSGATEKLKVMASFYPMYDFAVKIGGDKADVTVMIPDGTEPHDWEPAASDIKNLEEADFFIYSGAGMEHWVGDVLASLDNKKLVSVEASKGLALRAGNGEEEQKQYDPHVWLSPENAKKEMENIKAGFIEADPDNKTYYEANYDTYATKFDALDKEYKDTLSAMPNKDIVVSHEAFGYLCDAYGLNQVGIEGLSPDSEPDPARMAEIIDFVKKNHVKVIFFEDLVSPKVAKTIASETGADAQMLNPLEGLSDEELKNGADYFSVMENNLQQLKAALE